MRLIASPMIGANETVLIFVQHAAPSVNGMESLTITSSRTDSWMRCTACPRPVVVVDDSAATAGGVRPSARGGQAVGRFVVARSR